MTLRIFATLILLATGALAQTAETIIDTTYVTEDGVVVRYHGPLNPSELSGMPKALAMADDRVPLGYGWKSIRTWTEGDLRSEPIYTDTTLTTEWVELHHDADCGKKVAGNFAEFMDFVHYGTMSKLGMTLEEPVVLKVAWTADEYGEKWGLPWWVPGDVRDGFLVSQPIAMITGRGIAMESLTHIYVEMLLRRKTGDRLPYWFIYGACAFIAEAEWILKGQIDVIHEDLDISHDAMKRDLELFRGLGLTGKASDVPGGTDAERISSRIAYWHAHELMEGVIVGESLTKFKLLITEMEADASLDFESAVMAVYGKSVGELVTEYQLKFESEGN
jgi:hypothetical protein